VTDPYAAFRAAIEARDPDAAVALFAPDATFLSPIVHAPYPGREPLRAVLHAVMAVFEDFRYTAEYAGADGHVLEFACRIGDRACQGVDILRGRDGTLQELTVLVRPYSAATLLKDRMAAQLSGSP
jgi:SnoaL-like domain